MRRKQLRARKLNRNVVSYEDLLTRLEEALRTTAAMALARSIRERYRAALDR